MQIRCDSRLEVTAVPGFPEVQSGDDVGQLAIIALRRAGLELQDEDVLVFSSKVLSRAEGRFVDLSTVSPSPRANSLAAEVDKDPRLVELILGESTMVSRAKKGVLIVRHRLGFVMANAGIDLSNAAPGGNATPSVGPWAVLLPVDPDRSAQALREVFSPRIGVVVSDSFGRPFRLGTVGVAIGCAGLPPLWDQRNQRDMQGRPLEHTTTALADQVAATADLVAGQAAEGRALVVVRGLHFPASADTAQQINRRPHEDLYA
ncbi:MAG: coenzyme F420-0:L-glutamate ligase [Myxococcota bacterium]